MVKWSEKEGVLRIKKGADDLLSKKRGFFEKFVVFDVARIKSWVDFN